MQEDSFELHNYTRGFGHIFFHLKQLDGIAFRSKINKLLAIDKKFSLIVVEGDTSRDNLQSLGDLLFALQSAVKNKKKIIFITTNSNDALVDALKRELKKNIRPTIDKTSVNDVDIQTKKSILQEKSIIFQKQQKQISFSELMDIDVDDYLQKNEADLTNIISAEILVKLINGDAINVGNALPTHHGYDKDYYVNRKFNTTVILDKEKLQKAIKEKSANLKSDFFVITGICGKLLKDDIKWFDEKGIEAERRRLYESNSKPNIHWVALKFRRAKSYHLIWKKSDGSVSNVVNFRQVEGLSTSNEDEGLIDEDKFLDQNNDKIVIIADEAGSGKSTVLTSLSLKLKEKNPSMWIIRIDLNYHTKELSAELKNRKSGKPSFSKNDMNSVVEFLSHKILAAQKELKLSSKIEEYLFKNSFNCQGKLTLIFDGFDEISPYYKDIVIDLLLALNKSKAVKLVITTRPNMRTLLEHRLGKFSFILHPFSEEYEIKLLTKFWTKKLELIDLNEKQNKHLLIYAESLIARFLSSVDSWGLGNHFTAIPLHTLMLAEIFLRKQNPQEAWQGCEEYLNAKGYKPPKFPKVFDLSDLYARFVDTKLRFIHYEEKKRRVPSLINEEREIIKACKKLEKEHEILALSTAFKEDDLKGLFCQKTLKRREKWMKHNIDQNAGIISKVSKGKPHFVHLTFAEYFVANFFGRRKMEGSDQVVQKLILTNILMKSEHYIIRKFLHDYMKKSKLNKAVWSEAMQKLLDIACFYDGDLVYNRGMYRTDDPSLLEKMAGYDVEGKDIRQFCDTFIQQGFKNSLHELLIPHLLPLTDHRFIRAFGVYPKAFLCDSVSKIREKYSLGKLKNFALFEDIVKRMCLSDNQLLALFDNPLIFDLYVNDYVQFIQMLQKILSESSLHRILSKYHRNILCGLDELWPSLRYEEKVEVFKIKRLIRSVCHST